MLLRMVLCDAHRLLRKESIGAPFNILDFLALKERIHKQTFATNNWSSVCEPRRTISARFVYVVTSRSYLKSGFVSIYGNTAPYRKKGFRWKKCDADDDKVKNIRTRYRVWLHDVNSQIFEHLVASLASFNIKEYFWQFCASLLLRKFADERSYRTDFFTRSLQTTLIHFQPEFYGRFVRISLPFF